tara:strand:+ start:178 stop:345 length:168 start_codon:yes stop_codon:yes gene_type:complete
MIDLDELNRYIAQNSHKSESERLPIHNTKQSERILPKSEERAFGTEVFLSIMRNF